MTQLGVQNGLVDGEVYQLEWAADAVAPPRLWVQRAERLGDRSGLSAASLQALGKAEASIARSFGGGSRQILIGEYEKWLSWAEVNYEPARGSYAAFAAALWERLRAQHRVLHGDRRLRDEARDEQERDAASRNSMALVAYERKWRGRLKRLQLAHEQKWKVVGLTGDEVIDALTLRLIEAVLRRECFDAFQRPGCEWALLFLGKEKDVLRVRRRMFAVPRTKDVGQLDEPVLTPEDLLSAQQCARARECAKSTAELRLSRTQQRWLSALKMSLNAGGRAVFASGNLNHARVARLLGKDRTSSLRALRDIERIFQDELSRALGPEG